VRAQLKQIFKILIDVSATGTHIPIFKFIMPKLMNLKFNLNYHANASLKFSKEPSVHQQNNQK